MNHTYLLRLIIYISIPLTWANSALAQKGIKEAESILDRLEKRLLDQEYESLKFDDPKVERKKKNNIVKKQFKFNSNRVIQPRKSRNDQQFDKLEMAVYELEIEVEQLTADIQEAKRYILENAKLDNYVEITTELKETDKTIIRSLSAKLDNYTIYKIDETTGFWVSSANIPLYSGPLSPGKHTLIFQARVARRVDNNLPINNDTYHVIKEKYELVVPADKTRKKWSIVIESPQKTNFQAKAKLNSTKL